MESDGDRQRTRILVIGTPGAGKTPICHRIRDKYGFTYFYSSDLQTIRERMTQFKDQDWVLDGYPKTLFEARDLAKVAKISMVFFLDTPVEDIVERLKTRWVHEPSGRVYNTAFGEPVNPGKDDLTGEPLVQKNDDTPGYVMSRYKNYCTKVGPILQYYNGEKVLHIIDNAVNFEHSWAQVDQIITQNGVKPKAKRAADDDDDDDGSVAKTTPSPKSETVAEPDGETSKAETPETKPSEGENPEEK